MPLPLNRAGLPLVPWINVWSAELPPVLAPCSHSKGRLALTEGSRQGEGKPDLKNRHWARHREAFKRHLCDVCGRHVHPGDRHIVPIGTPMPALGVVRLGEGFSHLACLRHAATLCPVLRAMQTEPKVLPRRYGLLTATCVEGGRRVLLGDFFALAFGRYEALWPGTLAALNAAHNGIENPLAWDLTFTVRKPA